MTSDLDHLWMINNGPKIYSWCHSMTRGNYFDCRGVLRDFYQVLNTVWGGNLGSCPLRPEKFDHGIWWHLTYIWWLCISFLSKAKCRKKMKTYTQIIVCTSSTIGRYVTGLGCCSVSSQEKHIIDSCYTTV